MADHPVGHDYGQRAPLRIAQSRATKRPAYIDPQDAAPGICRICRSEATTDEPLFNPCRCSGSIQHVHQDCLMEWLSHSQKKYCELCKTPFRFKKYYNPDMPQSLPAAVFVRQVARYVVENSLAWLRAIIAVAFWVVGLPWFMRRGWSTMLWLSQESWGNTAGASVSTTSPASTVHLSSTLLGLDTCPASPLSAPTVTPAADFDKMVGWWSKPVTQYLVECFCWVTGLPVPSFPPLLNSQSRVNARKLHPTSARTKTMLGNVRFLRNLTSSDAFNQELISVLEGQIITVVVIVSFILVILVRDYVVQQQPEINMRGALEELEEAAARPPVVVEPARPPQSDESESESDEEDVDMIGREELPNRSNVLVDEGTRPLHHQSGELAAEHGRGGSSGSASESQRAHTINQSTESAHHHIASSSNSWVEDNSFYRRQSDGGSTDAILTPDYSQSDAADQSSSGDDSGSRKRAIESTRGDHNISFLAHDAEAGPSRPRAVSDGPQIPAPINPLANNTWSFNDPGRLVEDEVESNHGSGTQQTPVADPSAPFRTESIDASFTAGSSSTQGNHGNDDRDNQNTRTDRASHPSEAPQNPTPGPVAPAGSRHVADRVTDFMWGDLGDAARDLGAVNVPPVDEDTDDGHWLDIPMDDDHDVDGHPANDFDIAGIDEADDIEDDGAALDQEAIEDMEDFEGIMELLGMRGPVTNLFQNVIFCAVLVQAALVACVFIPFNAGRVTFWFAAKPARFSLMLFELSKVMQDLCFAMGGLISWVFFNLVDMFTGPFGGPVAAKVLAGRKGSWIFLKGALGRVGTFFELLSHDLSVPGSGMQLWSAASHEALLSIKTSISNAALAMGSLCSATSLGYMVVKAPTAVRDTAVWLFSVVSNPGSWVVNVSLARASNVRLEHAHWPSGDLTWAILAGYITIFAISGLYLKTGIRFARGTALEDWETGIVDSLNQASGILKVITIISIEMLVFPLYCGLLLDCALLPLFAGASIRSRMLFTYNNPWTSVFVHWFVGTGYMFHFALFVSMCRKIMRPGVLYFIRDPDDPEFHPVRDVLERNLTTQLRKILFSAFVYGALVIVCLGGVVWGLAFAAPSILPVHYSSNEPILEFPVDLLFYNFFMPLAFSVFKPGDGLHAMYRWCFRKGARILRLTYFLFGERRIDEEGTLQLPEDSPYRNSPLYRLAFLGLDASESQVIPKSWKDILDGASVDQSKSLPHEISRLRSRKASLVKSGQLIKDGRFVRAPASDRVKIPKGRRVFLDVNERGKRLDGRADEGLYASDQFQMVYVPPHLLGRTFLFILFIWTFAAVTGVSMTIIPLMLGRMMFKMAIPSHVRTNDIYAFCIGIHVFGIVGYSVFHMQKLWGKSLDWVSNARHGSQKWQSSVDVCTRVARVAYAYTCILVICPLALSLLVEFYINIPIHTLMNPPSDQPTSGTDIDGHHKVRVVEAWTLGLLYMRIAVKLIATFYGNTRFGLAMRAVLRRGWLDPDTRVLTKAFVLPGLFVTTIALAGPSIIVYVWESQGLFLHRQVPSTAAQRVTRYRQAYPLVALLAMLMRYFVAMKGSFNALKAQVRDDAYLMGERLQNYDGTPADARLGRTQRTGAPVVDHNL